MSVKFTGPTLLGVGNLRSEDPAIAERLAEWVPIKYIEEWFRARESKAGPENRVLVLRAETSAGKSTVLPASLFRTFIHSRGSRGLAACFQPTVLTAVDNVRQLCAQPAYRDMFKLGMNIGWSTGSSKLIPRGSGALLSATIGTLVMYLKTMRDVDFMNKFRFIMVDEVHERSLETDTAISLLKNLLMRQRDNISCPFVILMSATFAPDPFLNYFGCPKDNFIWVGGRSYPRDEMWEWNAGRVINNIEQSAAQIVEKIMIDGVEDEPGRGDILIFMPGNAEASKVLEWLLPINARAYKDGRPIFSPCELNSGVVSSRGLDYDKIISIPPELHDVTIERGVVVRGAVRRVIIGTAVAETGITLDNLKYVIDSGIARVIEFNPVYGVRGLITKPATRSRITQRIGRVGRKFPGVFYPLYPKYIYEMLEVQNLPQIITEDVSGMMLTIISEQLKYKESVGQRAEFLLKDIDLLEMPTMDALSAVMHKLNVLGIIAPPIESEFGKKATYGLTHIGAAIRGFNMIPVEILRMIYSGYAYGCSILDLASIGAYIMFDGKLATREGIQWQEIYSIALGACGSCGIGGTGNTGRTNGTGGIMGIVGGSSKDTGTIDLGTNNIYASRLIIGDQFIDGALLFNAAKYILASVRDSFAPLQEFKKWAERVGIVYSALQDFITLREELIEELILNKFDIYAGRAMSYAPEHLAETVLRLKHCIYDGFRCNLAVKTSTGQYTIKDLLIDAPELFANNEINTINGKKYGAIVKEKPEYFIYSGLNLKYNKMRGNYTIIPKHISVMDGYINPDMDFY